MTPPVINGLSFDVEEWFHVLDVPSAPQPRQWDAMPRTVERNTRRLLEILDDANVRATFFVLGWVADRYPHLVRDIAEAGHEVASHGDRHRLVYQQGRAGLEQDLCRARGLLENLIGQPVIGYRAPGFSIGPRAPWAFDVIRKAGFLYDSSLFPARRVHGGSPHGARVLHRIPVADGQHLAEFPSSVLEYGSLRLPFSGGGYVRLLPYPFIAWAMRRQNAHDDPVCVYMHPREVDPGHPRLRMSWKRSFQCYVNLQSTERKLRQMLVDFHFAPLADVLAERKVLDLPGAWTRSDRERKGIPAR